jgi:hypothetical protein
LRLESGKVELHPATGSRITTQAARASHFVHSLSHVRQSITFRAGLRQVNALPIVLDDHLQTFSLAMDA